MNELSEPIKVLKTTVEKLMALHQDLKKENTEINSEKEELQKTIDQQNATIELLEKNKEDLIENNNNEQNSIVSDTKLQINELVQEIDSCIALLK